MREIKNTKEVSGGNYQPKNLHGETICVPTPYTSFYDLEGGLADDFGPLVGSYNDMCSYLGAAKLEALKAGKDTAPYNEAIAKCRANVKALQQIQYDLVTLPSGLDLSSLYNEVAEIK